MGMPNDAKAQAVTLRVCCQSTAPVCSVGSGASPAAARAAVMAVRMPSLQHTAAGTGGTTEAAWTFTYRICYLGCWTHRTSRAQQTGYLHQQGICMRLRSTSQATLCKAASLCSTDLLAARGHTSHGTRYPATQHGLAVRLLTSSHRIM